MITKKCALALGGFALTMLIGLIFMHLMSLFHVSKWVGVGCGGGIFVVMLIFTVIYRKNKVLRYIVIPVNAVGDGLAISSLYVYLGGYPAVWESAAVFGGLCLLLLLYFLLTNIPFFRNHFIISMIAYLVIILAGLITGAVLTKSNAFYLALLGMIPFIAFFITTAARAVDISEHVKNMAYCSFAALIIIIIVVLAILSQGEGLDGLGGGGLEGDIAKGAKPKRNPYDFYVDL